jgi:hypothetical protein
MANWEMIGVLKSTRPLNDVSIFFGHWDMSAGAPPSTFENSLIDQTGAYTLESVISQG